MSELDKIEELEKEIEALKCTKDSIIPSYSYSKIRFSDLKKVVTLKRLYDNDIFDKWFNNNIDISQSDKEFLSNLISKFSFLIESYKEEDLKIKFISPILNRVDFLSKEKEIREYYNEKMIYKSEKFIFNGETDFMIAKGLEESEKPYFFIQEFKKSIKNDDPRPQLLAELISAIELNGNLSIKGAYIVGAIWNFVILEKVDKESYTYTISHNFDSTKIDELEDIYKNLIFIKNEILGENSEN